MRVGVVGAGISGLAAARTLNASGHAAVVFEKESLPGGRVATLAKENFVFDTGATSIAPRGTAIEEVMLRQLDISELVQVAKPIYLHSALRVMAGDRHKNSVARYTYRSGNARLPQLLAQGLDVRYKTPVEELGGRDGRYLVCGEEFDALVLTPPVPQVGPLLWSLEQSRAVANARYRSCISVALGFERELPPMTYHALLDPEQRHPLTWLSIESQKSPSRAPEGGTALVAQMSPAYSFNFWKHEDHEIVRDVMVYLGRLYGTETLGAPAVADIRRWKYSQPDSVAMFDTVNEVGSRLVMAGDGLTAGRVESAYESGVRAARLLIGA